MWAQELTALQTEHETGWPPREATARVPSPRRILRVKVPGPGPQAISKFMGMGAVVLEDDKGGVQDSVLPTNLLLDLDCSVFQRDVSSAAERPPGLEEGARGCSHGSWPQRGYPQKANQCYGGKGYAGLPPPPTADTGVGQSLQGDFLGSVEVEQPPRSSPTQCPRCDNHRGTQTRPSVPCGKAGLKPKIALTSVLLS